jgi:hypothetical protein
MFELPTEKERILFGQIPEGLDDWHETDGIQKVPMIYKAGIQDIPEKLLIFNSPKRFESPETTGLHSFDHGPKNITALTRPLTWIHKFADLKCVISPDSYMSPDLAPWQRARNTVLARAAGAVWQWRGLTVIPSIRWCDESDYELVSSGIQKGSVFAVTADADAKELKWLIEFESGLHAMIDIIEPEGVIIYGRVSPNFVRQLEKKTKVYLF